MGVLDGQAVSAAVTNPAFINKNQDDTMSNVLSFDRAGSGATIADIQAAVNKLYTATGASESQSGTAYNAPTNTITDGDSHETALGLLANKFEPATGHMHTGSAGDAPPISGGYITGVPYSQFVVTGSTLNAVTGSTYNVTSALSAKTASTGATSLGVITTAPENKIFLSGVGSFATDSFVDTAGNLVYARLTESSGTWTLSFYSLVAGSETAYSFTSATDVKWYYRELFNTLVSTPVYEPDYFELQFKGVKSLAATGLSPIYGNVVVAATSGITLSGSGQALTFTGNLSDLYPQDVAASGNWGTSEFISRADHAHQGVHSVAASGSTALYSDITFTAASGALIDQSGQNLEYSVDLYTSTPAAVTDTPTDGVSLQAARGDHAHEGVHSIAASGATPLLGDITLVGGTNVTLNQSGQEITINASASGGSGVTGPLITPHLSSGDQTVISGNSMFWPYLEIITADTFTIETGAQLISIGTIAVSGTIAASGDVVIIPD